MIKFSKNREVDPRYLNVPVKYISGIRGADTMSNSKPDIEGGYKRYVEFCKTRRDSKDEIISLKEFTKSVKDGWGSVDYLSPRNDKTFCILELTKRWALCGWRNNEKYSVGIPFKCKVIKKNRHIGIVYKDKFYPIDDLMAGCSNTFYSARDKDGRLRLYEDKPIRNKTHKGCWGGDVMMSIRLLINKELFPTLTWDDELIEVEISEVERKTLCSIKGYPVGGGYCNYYCESRDVCSQG